MCFNALSLGCALERPVIDGDIVNEVSNDLDIGDLLYEKGAITDEPKQSPELRPSMEPLVEPAKKVAPEGQWPAFPVAAASRTTPPVTAQATATAPGLSAAGLSAPGLSAAGLSAVRPMPEPIGKGNARPNVQSNRAQARPVAAAQPKAVAPPATSPRPPTPTVAQTPRPSSSQPTNARHASSSRLGGRVGGIAVKSVVVTVLAVAAGALWMKLPAHDADAAVQASATQPQTHGPAVDAPVRSDSRSEPPQINAAFERGKLTVSDRASEPSKSQKDVVQVSAQRAPKKTTATALNSGKPALDFGSQKNSPGNSQAVSAALIKKVEPKYPTEAVRSGIQGSVTVAAVIGADGKPRNVHAISGAPILAHAATEAVSQWLYQPYFVNGRPVEVETEVVVDFALH